MIHQLDRCVEIPLDATYLADPSGLSTASGSGTTTLQFLVAVMMSSVAREASLSPWVSRLAALSSPYVRPVTVLHRCRPSLPLQTPRVRVLSLSLYLSSTYLLDLSFSESSRVRRRCPYVCSRCRRSMTGGTMHACNVMGTAGVSGRSSHWRHS